MDLPPLKECIQIMLRVVIFTLLLFFANNYANSIVVEPQAYGSEKRIKYWRYYNNTVFKYTGFLNIPSYIEFEQGETVQNVSVAIQDKWSFEVKGSKLFLKPIAEDGGTIAIVMTNKRTYFFEFHVQVATSPFDPRLIFGVAFQYPQEFQSEGGEGNDGKNETVVLKYAGKDAPDLSKPQNYNFNYTMSGSDVIAPIKIFDDGQFTYLEFKDKNATLPAVFGVDSKGYEFLLNFRIIGDYMIIESISKSLTLRNGSDLLCVFNESEKAVPNGMSGVNPGALNGVKK